MECDFENGMMGWKGDGKIVEEILGNKVCSLKKTGTRYRQITHVFTLPKNGSVKLNFRARAIPGGSGIEFHRKNSIKGGILFSRVPLPANGEWVNVTHTASDKKGEGPLECTVIFSLQKGNGEIQLDDFTISTDGTPTPPSDDKTTLTANDSYMTDGLVAGNKHAPDIPLGLTQTKINGLLVMSLANDENVGEGSLMTFSAMRGDESEPSSVRFNQQVGVTMSKALKETVKFIEMRHDAWPKGRKMEISFEEKYSLKDGPSAAVACALLLESAIAGEELDRSFAVTGDMNADGSVQPVGGIGAKIRGAQNQECTHVAVPLKNATSVYDYVIENGIRPIVEIQVFSIANFDQAFALAQKERKLEVQGSIDSFDRITNLYQDKAKNFGTSVRHPKVIALLEEILKATPNHLSAKILLDHAQNRASKTLSLHGSTEFIEKRAFSIVDVIDASGRVSQVEGVKNNQVLDAISLLRRSHDMLDRRTWTWANDLIDFGTLLNQLQTNPPTTVKSRNALIGEINEAERSVRLQRKLLFDNPEVIEELLQ